MNLKKLILMISVGIGLASICLIMDMCSPNAMKVNCQYQNEHEQEQERVNPYSRPEWLYAGATTVVERPLPADAFKPQQNLNMSKVSLPVRCDVYVPQGIVSNDSLGSIYATISNAVARVDKMLAEKKYNIWHYSSVITLYQKDKDNLAVWYVNTAGDDILSIKFAKYENEEFSMLNLTEGYEINFKSDGELHMFSTLDNSHFLRCEHRIWGERPYYISFGSKINQTCTRILRFSKEGHLVEEKVEDSRNFPPPF